MTPKTLLPDIRPATAAEAGVASSIVQEAARWLLERGAPASMVWTPEQLAPERLAPAIAAGDLHLARRGEAVGTLTPPTLSNAPRREGAITARR